MAEPGPAEHLRLSRIAGEGAGHRLTQPVARSASFEPDKVDDDAAAELAQPQLARDRRRRCQVRRQRGALGRGRVGGSGIDIDQHRGPGLGDMDAAAAGQREARRERGGKGGVEVERPILAGAVCDLGLREGVAQLANDRGVVGEDMLGPGRQAQCQRAG